MKDKERDDLVAYFDAEEEECLPPADLHPYDSRVAWKKDNTVPFSDIARFTNYILRHLSADILDMGADHESR